MVINIIDCCTPGRIGEASYKGVYAYNNTLASSNSITQDCTYHQGSNYRQCIPDLQNGPRWSEVNLKECQPKTKTTQQLISLDMVSFGVFN